MPRNTLSDLNNHLFAQLERLNDEEFTGEKLQEEIARARAISSIAAQIISNGSLVLESQKFLREYGLIEHTKEKNKKIPPMLRAELVGE